MGTLVTYRDLPGGPTKIKFADEISRHCLCRKCQMLSLCMYTDTASHMFCDNCLNDQSYKHKKYEIYCPDERKEVSLAEMFEARDLVTILRDQYVECPNQPKCTVKLPLGQLENHYIECKEISSIKCTKCGQEVPSTLWIEHKTKCQVTCDEFTLKASDNRGAKRKPPPASSASPPFSSSRKNKSTKSTTAAASLPYPSSQRADATTGELNQQFPQIGHASTSTQPSVKPKFPTSAEPEKTTCKHCERKVKESNMPRHLEVCYKIPVPCPYCEKAISRSDLKAHVEQCEREFEARKTSDATAASSEKLNKKQKKETTKTMRDGDSSHPGTYSNAQAAYSGETRMGADVEYRDLPGGTHKLRFADELPRHVMCGTCGMLSMRMYEDEQGHAFCNVCVCRGSPAEAIFCKYENRNVSVDQLTEAFDIIQVIKDQVVFCPNEEKGCPVYSPLCKIEDHYLQCEKTEIDCLQCQQRIKGCHWKSHSKDCPRKIVQCRFCVAAFPQIDLQTHEALCAENPNCITSSTLQHSYPSNFSALTVPAAQTENGSEHVSFSMTSHSRDPVKIRHRGWPWLILPAVYCFACLAFFPRAAINVCVKPLLNIALRATRLTCRTVLSLYHAVLSAFGSSSKDSLQNAKFRAVHNKNFC
ncbi:uncharacterized protein LOC119464238 isoform X14 [Dermacentor silvarum]|uniref:uncharacterized protein LOC119464238 isoform X14 n=1 Tax=Dermacentor silvarum TaxID=543639 RepID=UPI002100B73A|nr:uncharacterized protein LOC119464238 isoform X14 [Dermacentor silvarum]